MSPTAEMELLLVWAKSRQFSVDLQAEIYQQHNFTLKTLLWSTTLIKYS